LIGVMSWNRPLFLPALGAALVTATGATLGAMLFGGLWMLARRAPMLPRAKSATPGEVPSEQ
jgi:hypothetical protein